MKKIYILFAALAICAVLALISCGKSTKTSLTVKIWQTEVDDNANQELEDIKNKVIAEAKAKWPDLDLNIEISSVAWGILSTQLTNSIASNQLPDMSHVQPFMLAHYADKGLLEPISEQQYQDILGGSHVLDVADPIGKSNGVRYGIPHALGVTGFGYQKALFPILPKTNDELLKCLADLKARYPDDPTKWSVMLPGADSFFMDQWICEMITNNGGSLFDETSSKPQLDTPKVKEVYDFLNRLRPYLASAWTTQKYKDQFKLLKNQQVALLPVTYVRATKVLDEVKDGDSLFGFMDQTRGPSFVGQHTYATLDCEPFVLFRQGRTRKVTVNGSEVSAYDICQMFLKRYYETSSYSKFCATVPMHLTPITQEAAESDPYKSSELIKRWPSWFKRSSELLKSKRVRPILISNDKASEMTFLMEFQSSQILTNAAISVMSGGGTTIDQALKEAQTRAETIVKDHGVRW